MQALAGSAIAIFIVASILVAVRLLVLHRRTRAWPELLLGGMLLLSVGIGYSSRIASFRSGPAWAGPLTIVSELAVATGFCLLFVFTCRVFRPEKAWARVLVAVGMTTLLGNAFYGCLQHVGDARAVVDEPAVRIVSSVAPVFVAYVWTAFESLRYYTMMRRRAQLGLADIAVCERFLIWGLMAASATAGVALNAVAIGLRMDPYSNPGVLLASAFTGFAQAVFLVLAFAPPTFYLEWTRRRASAVGN